MFDLWEFIRGRCEAESVATVDPSILNQAVTLMLRNLSRKLTQEAVKDVLDERGLRGKFSYIYVPQIFVRRSTTGYAFVRFRTAFYAQECYRVCHGKPFGIMSRTKLCRVCFANIQDDIIGVMGMPRRKYDGEEPDILVCNDPIDGPEAEAWPSADGVGVGAGWGVADVAGAAVSLQPSSGAAEAARPWEEAAWAPDGAAERAALRATTRQLEVMQMSEFFAEMRCAGASDDQDDGGARHGAAGPPASSASGWEASERGGGARCSGLSLTLSRFGAPDSPAS
mmetsp:Transcript_128591/g.359838  ORF Transcript_128591/g.359838 Transcript_128591/m.359838 type:complete len:282 (+) Transcript_128591:67-912(+)